MKYLLLITETWTIAFLKRLSLILRFNGIAYCNPPKGQMTIRAVARKDVCFGSKTLLLNCYDGSYAKVLHAKFRRQNIWLCVQVSGLNRAWFSETVIDIIGEIKHGVYGLNDKDGTFVVCLCCLCSKVKVFVLDWRWILGLVFVCVIYLKKRTRNLKKLKGIFFFPFAVA